MKFFETIRDLLIKNLIEKKTDLKERLELISKYSNNHQIKLPMQIVSYIRFCVNIFFT